VNKVERAAFHKNAAEEIVKDKVAREEKKAEKKGKKN
jgi:hypothetical protein